MFTIEDFDIIKWWENTYYWEWYYPYRPTNSIWEWVEIEIPIAELGVWCDIHLDNFGSIKLRGRK